MHINEDKIGNKRQIRFNNSVPLVLQYVQANDTGGATNVRMPDLR